MEDRVTLVAEKVLQKLDGFVDGVTPENLNPQTMKHITATLKDIRDLTTQDQSKDAQLLVTFDHPEWKE